MDTKRFKEELTGLLLTPSGDAPFSALRIITHGMAGVRTAKLINFACRCMDADEIYLEVGTFSGYTLVSAAFQSNAVCVGVDDFSLKEVIRPEAREMAKGIIREKLQKNLAEHGSSSSKFIESDFRSVSLSDEAIGKLAVLFIDGEHNYQDVKETLEKFEPFLAKEALVIFDDVQFGGIPRYIQEMTASGRYEILAYLVNTVHDHDKNVHKNMPLDEFIANGICVLTRKSDA